MNRLLSVALMLGPWMTALSPPACACSTFMIRHGDTLLVGHNLDERGTGSWPGLVIVNQRGVAKQARTWSDIGRDTIPAGRLGWVSKYGSITTNGFSRELPDGGMNEAGLVVCEMTLAETCFVEDDRLPPMFMMQWIQYLLDTCGSVEEVIGSAKSLALDGWGWHFFIADAQGNAAVIEFLDGKLVIFTGESMPVLVLCNTRYADELSRLKEYVGFGGEKPVSLTKLDRLTRLASQGIRFLKGEKPRWSTDVDVPRFVGAAHRLQTYDPSQSPSKQAFSVLKQLDKYGATRWSIVYDIKGRRIEFHTSACPTPRYCSMRSFDFSDDGPPLAADINATTTGDIRSLFRPCTREMNRDLVTKVVHRIEEIHGPGPIYLGTKASGQEFTPEQLREWLNTFPSSITGKGDRPE